MLSSFFFKSASLFQAGNECSLFFGGFFNQKFGTAHWAFSIEGFIPGGKGTIWKTTAAVENFTTFGGTLDNVSGTVLFRAADTDLFAVAVRIQRLGIFALRITAAGQKTSIATFFDNHRSAALVTHFIGGFFLGLFLWLNNTFLIPDVVIGVCAIRISGASKKMSVLSDFNAYRFTALGALQIGGYADAFNAEHFLGCSVQIFTKRLVKLS